MLIHNKQVIVYDIEIFPNVFHCVCKNTENNEIKYFEISNRKNELEELLKYYYYDNKYKLFCGYNNKHYDDVIINYIIDLKDIMVNKNHNIITKSLYKLSSLIISSNNTKDNIELYKKWKYSNYFESMDLLTMLFSSKLRIGLKEMQLTMHYKNVQEFDGNFNEEIFTDSDINNMIKYNVNDVESTHELLNRLSKDIELRLFIEKEYGFNALSMDSVKFGETILATIYCKNANITYKELKEMCSPMDYVALKDVILPCISFNNNILKNVLKEMQDQIVYTKERKGYEKKFLLNGIKYSVGVGGIHSINTPEIFKSNKDEYIGHADVTSMYPSFIDIYGWIPRHLGKVFHDTYSSIKKERLLAKHSGQKLKSDALKLTLNSVTGKMQQETSWMYDPLNVFKIRINGQLVLLMLVDKLLEINCKIIQVNTDGIMYKAKRTDRNRITRAISQIEDLTKLEFETDEYEAFYQYAVNDYFGIIKGYSEKKDKDLIERKGMFITETKLGKGLAPTIIPKAVINYFLTGVSTSEYIRNHTNIKDFLIGQRVDKKFNIWWGDTPVQRINRFYASTNGKYLFKKSINENNTEKVANMLTKSGVTILNELKTVPISQYKINYTYYISEANKIIAEFKTKQLELF